jgi:hypothetical protein
MLRSRELGSPHPREFNVAVSSGVGQVSPAVSRTATPICELICSFEINERCTAVGEPAPRAHSLPPHHRPLVALTRTRPNPPPRFELCPQLHTTSAQLLSLPPPLHTTSFHPHAHSPFTVAPERLCAVEAADTTPRLPLESRAARRGGHATLAAAEKRAASSPSTCRGYCEVRRAAEGAGSTSPRNAEFRGSFFSVIFNLWRWLFTLLGGG